jgi:hypothetical protein
LLNLGEVATGAASIRRSPIGRSMQNPDAPAEQVGEHAAEFETEAGPTPGDGPVAGNAHALNGFVAWLNDHVRCAELFAEGDPLPMTAQEDDLLEAEAPRGDHAAQTDRSIADTGGCFPRPNAGSACCMMARRQHVGQGESA